MSPPSLLHKRRWWPVVSVTLVAMAARLGFAAYWNWRLPSDRTRLGGDEIGYDQLARDLLQGWGFTWPGRVPIYPLWLATLHRLTDFSYVAITYIQAAAGALVAPLTYLLARRIMGESWAVAAGLLVAVHFVLVRQSVLPQSEVLFVPAMLLATIALHDLLHTSERRDAVRAGVWTGVSNLIRPTVILLPLFVVLALAVYRGGRVALRAGSIVVVATLLVVTPWMIHNAIRYRTFLPLATSNAILWQGSPEYYHLLTRDGYTYLRIWNEVLYSDDPAVPDPGTIEGERYWRSRALRSIAAEPGVYLRYTAEKAVTYWVGDPHADWGGHRPFTISALRAGGYGPVETALFTLSRLLPLIAFASLLFCVRRWRELLAIVTVLSYTTLLHAATHAEARLSEPFHPLLIVLWLFAVSELRHRLDVLRPVWSSLSARAKRPAADIESRTWRSNGPST